MIQELYFDEKLRQKIQAVLSRYGANAADFEEVFHTTLMQFVKTVIKNTDIQINTSLYAYLAGISKYTWLNKAKKENRIRTEQMDDQFDLTSDTTPESLLLDQSKVNVLQGLLERLGKNCKEVLMYWANGYSMNEIADLMGYKSDKMAKKKKYKCFKELLDYLEAHPEIKNALG